MEVKHTPETEIIIIRGSGHGTVDGVIRPVDEINKMVNDALKNGKAKKLIDTDETLMYNLLP